MRQFLAYFLLSMILIATSCQKKENKDVKIIPNPVEYTINKGTFEINAQTRILLQAEDEASQEVAQFLSEWMSESLGYPLIIDSEQDKKNVIVLSTSANPDIGEEGYFLQVSEDKIQLEALDSRGLFYGIQTIFQLLPVEVFSPTNIKNVKWEIPCCEVKDKPRFSWRGMHLDVSRHFFPLEFIKKYIDLIAMHKMNVFHWHLTDDNGWRLEIKAYPLLTEVSAWRVDREDMPWREVTPPEPGEEATYGGYYSQEEVKEIIAYAAQRQITVIPEIEMPGHTSEVFAAYPELSCSGEKLYVQPGSYWPNEDIFCAGKEEPFEFIENVLTEVIELFPSEYVHIGGDEANKVSWEECNKCQQRIKEEGLADEHELQSYFIKRIEKFLTSKGKKLIGWDEILEGGLAPDATVMSWRGFQGGIDAASQGHDVIMCPTSHCYFDYYQGNPDFEPEAIGGFTTLKKVYAFEPVPEALNENEAAYILGGQGNVWTEYIATPEHAEYMAVPRMTALAEVLWSPDDRMDWEDFRYRLNHQFLRFDQMNVNYALGSWKVDIQPELLEDGSYSIVLDSEQPEYKIHFTSDGSDPGTASLVYSEPLKIDQSTVIKAGIFKEGQLMEAYSEQSIVWHKGIGEEGILAFQPSDWYKGQGVISLTDGLKGSGNFRDGYWLGFEGEELAFIMDMGETTEISSISASFFQSTGAWIFMPENVIFEIKDETQRTIAQKTIQPETTVEAKGAVIEELVAEFDKVKGQYIRVFTKTPLKVPEWHEGAGNKSWIFIDEIIIQ